MLLVSIHEHVAAKVGVSICLGEFEVLNFLDHCFLETLVSFFVQAAYVPHQVTVDGVDQGIFVHGLLEPQRQDVVLLVNVSALAEGCSEIDWLLLAIDIIHEELMESFDLGKRAHLY